MCDNNESVPQNEEIAEQEPAEVNQEIEAQQPQEETAEAKLAATQAELEQVREQLKRVAAESENFRRRQEANLERRIDNAKDTMFRKLLPIVDQLEMAVVAASQESGTKEALLKGVEAVLKNALKSFESLGVTPIEAVGQTFDPNLHEAMLVEEREDLPDETVSMELQKGYRCGERVLRPSMVKVARMPK